MPLYTNRVAAALEAKASAFQTIEQTIQANLALLRSALDQFALMTQQEIEDRLGDVSHPGARPTIEQDTQPLVVPFAVDWSNHQQARAWAMETLQGVVTCAVDGSQISPSKDLSIPVGLVQIGWFENPHDSTLPYLKDVKVELLSPQELSGEESSFGDQAVEWRRFKGEVEQILAFMERQAGKSALVFFDGSLIISFIELLYPVQQLEYIYLMETLLAKSEATRVPVIGYVDTSYARDLTVLLANLSGYQGKTRVSDTALFRERMNWGDRTRLFICSRGDRVIRNDFYEQVCFTYCKTTRGNPPARIEIPRWALEEGLHQWVLDVVRAECIVGLGYPYPLETADAVAVLSSEDRQRFYQMFQQFAEARTLPLHFSRKSMSKQSRRL